MIDAAKVEAAAEALAAARSPGAALGGLPPELAPSDADEAWAMHEAVVAKRAPVAAWKTGAPTPTAPAGAGMITADTVFTGPASFGAEAFRLCAVEAEIAVTLAADLGPRESPYSREDVLAAVGSWHAAIEVLDTAFSADGWAAIDALWRMADRQSHGALILGPGAAKPPAGPLDQAAVTLAIDGETKFSHRGGNTGGDPVRLLVELANLRRSTTRPLRAGDVVTTGSTTPFLRAWPGQRVRAEFDSLEPVEMVIQAGV